MVNLRHLFQRLFHGLFKKALRILSCKLLFNFKTVQIWRLMRSAQILLFMSLQQIQTLHPALKCGAQQFFVQYRFVSLL